MKKRIIFDFDGVLADSLYVTMENINYLSENGFREIPLVYNQHDMSKLFDVKLGDSLYKYGYDKRKTKEFFDLHTSLMCRDAEKIFVFDDILHFLGTSQYNVSIVSSSYCTYMDTILSNRLKDPLQIFSDITGREIQGSKPDKINSILHKYDIVRSDVIYIGDTVSDILICKEMGVDIVAVGYGFHPYKYLLDFAPDYCVQNQPELIELLSSLCLRAV